LALDISTREEDRIYGRRWIRFLSMAKACLGTESGASVLDYTGEIQRKTEAYLAKYPDTEFEELRRLFFEEADGRVVMNVISPRCFEAAALRTLMVMYPGEYGGILEPNRHYAVLRPDHSNIEEIVDIIRTPRLAEPIIKRAYVEIAQSGRWSFDALTRHFDDVISEEGGLVRTRVVVGLASRVAFGSMMARSGKRLRHAVVVNGRRAERLIVSVVRSLPPVVSRPAELRLRKARKFARKMLLDNKNSGGASD
jgi:hypothetical protein